MKTFMFSFMSVTGCFSSLQKLLSKFVKIQSFIFSQDFSKDPKNAFKRSLPESLCFTSDLDPSGVRRQRRQRQRRQDLQSVVLDRRSKRHWVQSGQK